MYFVEMKGFVTRIAFFKMSNCWLNRLTISKSWINKSPYKGEKMKNKLFCLQRHNTKKESMNY